MRIKNLGISSFGKLDGVSIGLDDKMTVIYGKNEAGKSSIATFMKYMLYGFDSSKKADVGENQKKKYMPWNSNECSGEMTFCAADGKVYTAVRKTAQRNQNTVLDQNYMPVTSENAGDYFLGVNENAYKKTAFIGQNDAVFSDEGELDSAIRNMIFSADESVDTQKALKKIEDIRKFYLGKTGRSGKIFELENELSELCVQRDKWQDGHKELLSSEYQLAEIQKKIAFNKGKKDLLTKEKENLEYYEAKCTLDRIEKARAEFEKSKEQYSAHCELMKNGTFVPDAEFVSGVRNVLSSIASQEKRVEDDGENLERAEHNLDSVCSDEMQRRVFDTLSSRGETAKGLLSRISELKARKKKTKILAIVLTCLVLTIPVAIFFYISSSKISKCLCDICKIYGCENISELENRLAGEGSYKAAIDAARNYLDDAKAKLEKSTSELEEFKKKLSELASDGGFAQENAEQYVKDATEWIEKSAFLEACCRENHASLRALVSSVDVDELKELAAKLDESIEIRDAKTVTQQLTFYTQANEALTVRERELEKQAAVLSNTLPRPSEIQSRILSLTEQLSEMKQRHAALSLAAETLGKASENMRSEASPKIAAETSELFSEITGGKYRALYADSEMKLTFLESGEAEVRDAGYLSCGTLDAAYISLRIALCEFLYKEHPTLVFDDAFANMDEERLKNTLDFLVRLSEDFQIVILSCHTREKEYLKDKAKIIDFEV